MLTQLAYRAKVISVNRKRKLKSKLVGIGVFATYLGWAITIKSILSHGFNAAVWVVRLFLYNEGLEVALKIISLINYEYQ